MLLIVRRRADFHSPEKLARIEETLWSALTQLEEQRMLQVELAAPAGRVGNPDLAARCHTRAAEIDTIAQKGRVIWC